MTFSVNIGYSCLNETSRCLLNISAKTLLLPHTWTNVHSELYFAAIKNRDLIKFIKSTDLEELLFTACTTVVLSQCKINLLHDNVADQV